MARLLFLLAASAAELVVAAPAHASEQSEGWWPWRSGCPARGYCEEEALEDAYLSTAAYCGAPRSSTAALEAWACGPPCARGRRVRHAKLVLGDGRGSDAAAVVGVRERPLRRRQCVVAFRGTTDLSGWVEDIRSGRHVDTNVHGLSCHHDNKTCQVGFGWMLTYSSMRAYVKGNLSAIGCGPGSSVAVSGHSLGAAVAQLAMFDLAGDGYQIDRSYLFGSPRVGNAAWAAAFTAALPSAEVFRVTHRRDPVPHLPLESFGFLHSATEVFYRNTTADGYSVCTDPEANECSSRYANPVALILQCVRSVGNCDHVWYMVDNKDIPMGGASCAVDADIGRSMAEFV